MSDKRKEKRSKEEIAKEFDLPERKSKIASIIKQDQGGETYCVCRSSDVSRFMICCDGCEEWYHGDCIFITEKEAKFIKRYFCQGCIDENPDLRIEYRVVQTEKVIPVPTSTATGVTNTNSVNNSSDTEKRVKFNGENEVKRTNRCGMCEGCRTPNCGECNSCRIRVGHKPRCELRTCILQLQQEDQTATTVSSSSIRYKRKEKPTKERSRKRKRSLTPEVFINPELQGDRHCYGPSCKSNARPQSKYCSDECGIRLASSRIIRVLPQRIQEWNLAPCHADNDNKKQLDQLRAKQTVVQIALKELDRRQGELDMIVQNAKQTTLDSNRFTDSNDIEDEQSMYCITCGHEIHSRTAIKHMEKCFNKYESQASFGSVFKTRFEGNNVFCDFYNTVSKTYCKRLRVLCPEHCKDPKMSDNDVCGCPLVQNVFNPTGEFCRAPKKNCFKHYMWEKIRRAEIDLERLRQWIKMEELVEQERQIRSQLIGRAGVLGLLLHSTFNHDIVEEICRQQNQQIECLQKQMLEQKQHLDKEHQKQVLAGQSGQQQIQLLQQQKQLHLQQMKLQQLCMQMQQIQTQPQQKQQLQQQQTSEHLLQLKQQHPFQQKQHHVVHQQTRLNQQQQQHLQRTQLILQQSSQKPPVQLQYVNVLHS